jgi:DNA-binding SARP family transcriptional activator
LARPVTTPPVVAPNPASEHGPGVQLRMLNGFDLVIDNQPVHLQRNEQRLLAYLSLRRRTLCRRHVASTLWMDRRERNAHASLRSSLWRLRQAGAPVVDTCHDELRLSPGVRTDVHDLNVQARRLLDSRAAWSSLGTPIATLSGELLPGWGEEWVLFERECLRQLQLHALERLAERLLAAGRPIDALDAAMTAVVSEPLRETAQRLVILAHLAEGNRSEALRRYFAYEQMLDAELGVQPSPQLAQLVAGLSRPRAARSAPVTTQR